MPVGQKCTDVSPEPLVINPVEKKSVQCLRVRAEDVSISLITTRHQKCLTVKPEELGITPIEKVDTSCVRVKPE